MSNTTYAAVAAAVYRRVAASTSDDISLVVRGTAGLVADMIEKEAVHFILPRNGVLFADGLKGLRDADLMRLPFPVVTLSFDANAEGGGLAKILVLAKQDDETERIRLTVAANSIGDGWIPSRLSQIFDDEWLGDDGIVHYSEARLFEGIVDSDDEDALVKFEDVVGRISVLAITEFCEAAMCSNVRDMVVRKADPRINAKRVRKGKLPIYDARVLVVEPGKHTQAGAGGCGTDRRGPRQHLRRGHIRRLGDGRTVWVQSCTVGSASAGRIDKDYLMVGGGET